MNEYKYIFAYCLLPYWCEKCNQYEWIWNSGDTDLLEDVRCVKCSENMKLVLEKFPAPRIPELTPLGIRWFVTESKELYTKRIKQQIIDMEDNLFQDTTRKIVERSLIEAYTPDKVYLVDPLTLNFEEQIEILLNTD